MVLPLGSFGLIDHKPKTSGLPLNINLNLNMTGMLRMICVRLLVFPIVTQSVAQQQHRVWVGGVVASGGWDVLHIMWSLLLMLRLSWAVTQSCSSCS
jgi:hypothetical protein